MNLVNLNPDLLKAICSDRVLDLWKYLTALQTSTRDVTDVSSEINTILLHACAEGALKCLQALVTDQYANKYLDVNCSDEDGDTGLHLALKRYQINVAQILLDEGNLDLTIRNKCEQSVLDLVCKQRVLQLLPKLTDLSEIKFTNEESRATYEYYAVISAIDSDTPEVLHYLLQQGFRVHHNIDEEIGTPLHHAAERGFSEGVARLLQCGAEVEALTRSTLQTPLMIAARCGHLSVVTKLVDAGAEIDRQTEECSTPLTVACHFGHEDVAFYLLDRGADCSVSNPWGFTPLFMATDSPSILRRVLREGGVDVDQRCGERLEAPLHLAAVIGSSESFDLLLTSGADVNTLTLYRESPLWLALWKSHNHIMETCLAYNAHIHTTSNGCQVYAWEYTPLELALGLCNLEAAHYLHLAGARCVNDVYFPDGKYSDCNLFPPWVRLRVEVLEFVYNNKILCDWLEYIGRNPRTLANWCVIRVRELLGCKHFVTRVSQLQLPWRLKDMLYITSSVKPVPAL